MSATIEVEDDNGDHVTSFAGCEVRAYDPRQGIGPTGQVAYRIEPEETWVPTAFAETLRLLRTLTDDAVAPQIEALVIGCWCGESEQTSAPVVDLLVERAPRLTALRAIYLGDIIPEEDEISWICQGDCAPLLTAFPALEHLRVRAPGQFLAPGRHRSPGDPAEALLAAPAIKGLERLDLHHNFLTPPVVERLLGLGIPELETDPEDAEEEEDEGVIYRYPAVGE